MVLPYGGTLTEREVDLNFFSLCRMFEMGVIKAITIEPEPAEE